MTGPSPVLPPGGSSLLDGDHTAGSASAALAGPGGERGAPAELDTGPSTISASLAAADRTIGATSGTRSCVTRADGPETEPATHAVSLLGISTDVVAFSKGLVLLLAVALDIFDKRRASASRG